MPEAKLFGVVCIAIRGIEELARSVGDVLFGLFVEAGKEFVGTSTEDDSEGESSGKSRLLREVFVADNATAESAAKKKRDVALCEPGALAVHAQVVAEFLSHVGYNGAVIAVG